MSNPISRRKFVYGSSIVVAGIGLSSLFGCASGTTEAEPETEATEGAETTEEAAPAEENVTIRLAGLKGPTSMGMMKMLEDNEAGLTKNTYEFSMGATGDELVPKILQGELDILAVPSNLGAVLYNNSQGGVQMLAANMLGAIYVLEKDGETVNSMEDLAGKTIYTVGKGSTPQFLLAYLLDQHGLIMDEDVMVEWRDDPTEIVGLLAAGTAEIVMLPQPFVTVAQTQVENLRIALDMNAEWDALDNGSKLITAGLIARSDFVNEHPQQVSDFLDELAASTEWTNDNVEEAAQLIEKYDIVPAAIAQQALPYCNVVCITGDEMKTSTEAYFQVLFDQNPEAVGGAMPEDDFYYEP
ncbi:MAG: ABC transporter substrate-binding protein [Eggerthellaceae bacterium]|nr:ABC transporter substrate-binding protein [Eggerthellaceae bacterium]